MSNPLSPGLPSCPWTALWSAESVDAALQAAVKAALAVSGGRWAVLWERDGYGVFHPVLAEGLSADACTSWSPPTDWEAPQIGWQSDPLWAQWQKFLPSLPLEGAAWSRALGITVEMWCGLVTVWGSGPEPSDAELRAVGAELSHHAALALGRLWRSEGMARRLRALEILAGLSPVVSTDWDWPSILEHTIAKFRDVFDAEGGGIMLWDPEVERLVLQEPAFGVDPHLIKEYQVSLRDGGNAVNVFLTGRPYWSNQAERDPNVLQYFIRLFHTRNLATVPLKVKDRRIGVFHLMNKRNGVWQAEDVALFEHLADQVGYIIENARLVAEQARQQKELGHALNALAQKNREVEAQNQMLAALAHLQTALTRGLIESRGWDHLARALAQFLKCPVALEDARERPVSHASETGQPAPTVGTAPAPPLTQKYPITSGGRLFGYVCVPKAYPMTQIRRMAVEQAAMAAALAFVHQENMAQQRLRLAGRFFSMLLEGGLKSPEEIATQAGNLEVSFEQRRRLLVIRFEGVPSSLWINDLANVRRALEPLLAEPQLSGILTYAREHLVVLINDAAHSRLHRAALEISAIVDRRIQSDGLRLAVSAAVSKPEDYPQAFNEAAHALSVVPIKRLVWAEMVGIADLVRQLSSSSDVIGVIRRTLGPLLACPPSLRKKLLSTLEAYLNSGGQLSTTAALCGTHVNTVRYRLTRVEDLLKIRLEDSEVRFNLQLALRVWRAGEGQVTAERE